MINTRLSKTIILVCLLTVLIVASVATTIAYIMARTPSLENTFEPSRVACEVVESFDGTTKTDVAVKNTGNISAYLRAMVIVNWVSEQDGAVYPQVPMASTDYMISFGSSQWKIGADGFYYYTVSVAPEEISEDLIASLTDLGTAPEGYRLSVQLIATAVQSTPKTAAQELWGVTITDDGRLIP